ncbi:(2Fe-2S)-binding protein, partial [Candidatus Poribacteria bacterium]|nr:(2Fe-2S)-binding protein [Candidatus Poribacteria bacterium]
MRIKNHPILGLIEEKEEVTITVDGMPVKAFKGETIASALIASGIKVFRKTRVRKEPRG